jgi:hypothetical protein
MFCTQCTLLAINIFLISEVCLACRSEAEVRLVRANQIHAGVPAFGTSLTPVIGRKLGCGLLRTISVAHD